MPKITPNLWFDTQAREAAEYYCSIFPNSRMTQVTYYGENDRRPKGMELTVTYLLDGQEYTNINGGPEFVFDEAMSLLINCADQQEIDYYWDRLCDGGEPSMCGWLKDRYGVSWQVVPSDWNSWLDPSDGSRAERVMGAVYAMRKIDIAEIRRAADIA
jgi:predicted 3-demethylubiquinone-9 3-methyltransferase (glyoxalase superfamily)